MTIQPSHATEDYLRAIYNITEQGGQAATTSEIATALDIRPASVTGMVQKMAQAEPPLVVYQRHRGVELTAAGRQAALQTMRRHRLLETFLHDRLGYDWAEVHDEADQLEHVISPVLEARMAALLNHPERDPHGQRIPTADLELAPSTAVPLSTVACGHTAVIRYVRDNNPELLRQAAGLGLLPGKRLVVQHTPAGLLVTVDETGETAVVPPALLAIIFVAPSGST